MGRRPGKCLLKARNDYGQSLPDVLKRLSTLMDMELGDLSEPSDIFIIVDEMGARHYVFHLRNSLRCCEKEWSWEANFFRTGVPYNLMISRTCTSTNILLAVARAAELCLQQEAALKEASDDL